MSITYEKKTGLTERDDLNDIQTRKTQHYTQDKATHREFCL